MSQTLASVRIVLVIENPDYNLHAAAALASCGGIVWSEVHGCDAALTWLDIHQTDAILLLLNPVDYDSLTRLRQHWHGPLFCYCDDSEEALLAVESAGALAILPTSSIRQSANNLRFLTRLIAPKSAPTREDALHETPLASEQPAPPALSESDRRLEQAQRMEAVGRLAGGIAHDFNNLLTVIGSYSDLSMRKLDEGHVVKRYVEQIRKASATAGNLTRQLLAFSRRQVLQPRVVVPNEIVEEISFMVQSLMGAGIELKVQLEPNLGKIEADPVQIQQVLLNLIVNAKDAMPDGGLLNIETRNFELDERFSSQVTTLKPGAYVRLTVADTGIGMDAETLARIYEPFFTTKPKGRGTGLGLPTVYGIVQQSGGHISVYSEVGKGTTFHIYLPRVDKLLAQHGEVEEATITYSGNETVLLVEDEPAVRELAAMVLRESGYTVLTAAMPEEAIKLEGAFDGEIDLLLTDVIMPRMTGREMAIRIAQRRPQTPVVYMSGYTEEVMAFQQLLESGAYLIEKPFYPHDLLRMVRRAIEHPLGNENGLKGREAA